MPASFESEHVQPSESVDSVDDVETAAQARDDDLNSLSVDARELYQRLTREGADARDRLAQIDLGLQERIAQLSATQRTSTSEREPHAKVSAPLQTSRTSVQSTASTWAAIQARMLSESPIAIGAYSVNDSQDTSSRTQGTTPSATPPRADASPRQALLEQPRRPMAATAIVAALLLVALAVGLFAFHGHMGRTGPGNNGQQPTPPPAVNVPGVIYSAAAALSPTDVWAVGYGNTDGDSSHSLNTPNMSVISHFDGKQWRIDENTIFKGSILSGIAMDSATDGWAVGDHIVDPTTNAHVPFLVHYTQGRWVPQTMDRLNGYLSRVQLFGPDAGWAWGSVKGANDAVSVFLHLQHGIWTPITFAPPQAAATQTAATSSVSPLAYHVPLSPAFATSGSGVPGPVTQAQFLSDTEGWAIGHDTAGQAVWQYHNGQWQTALHLPVTPSTAEFLGLGVNASTDVWVLGTAVVGQAFSAAKLAFDPLSPHSSLSGGDGGPWVYLHLYGHTWSSVPADSSVGTGFLDGATWVTSYHLFGQQPMQPMVVGLLHNQGGHWTTTTFPQPVLRVLSVRTVADGSTLAVAVTGAEAGPQSLQLLQYSNGKWSRFAA